MGALAGFLQKQLPVRLTEAVVVRRIIGQKSREQMRAHDSAPLNGEEQITGHGLTLSKCHHSRVKTGRFCSFLHSLPTLKFLYLP
jgi:hypothetical protein